VCQTEHDDSDNERQHRRTSTSFLVHAVGKIACRHDGYTCQQSGAKAGDCSHETARNSGRLMLALPIRRGSSHTLAFSRTPPASLSPFDTGVDRTRTLLAGGPKTSSWSCVVDGRHLAAREYDVDVAEAATIGRDNRRGAGRAVTMAGRQAFPWRRRGFILPRVATRISAVGAFQRSMLYRILNPLKTDELADKAEALPTYRAIGTGGVVRRSSCSSRRPDRRTGSVYSPLGR
jgi:hypothetical protein